MPYKDKSRYQTEEYREYKRNYQRAWHQRHKERRLAKVHKRKDMLQDFYKELKENLACAQCGENHPATLHFHHRDPQLKTFNVSTYIQHAYGIERIKNEIAKCTVLCANCHAKLHYELIKGDQSLAQDSLAVGLQYIEQELGILQEEG
jgi:hypothetical protein